MSKSLLLIATICSIVLLCMVTQFLRNPITVAQATNSEAKFFTSPRPINSITTSQLLNPYYSLKTLLHREAPTLQNHVINTALTTLHCAEQLNIQHNNILTIIDYSRPSNEKRLWVFDLEEKKLLFYTYIAHGIKSGTLNTNYFSNINNSKASSIGVYTTDKAYYGREGMALKLNGLDRGINDNAANRAIVMHGGWYVDKQFIKLYGRPGRSWGCPALPLHLAKPIINAIKDNSLMVVYYPSDNWLFHSEFLHCDPISSIETLNESEDNRLAILSEPEQREDILFVDKSGNTQHEEQEPILVLSANFYTKLFNKSAPLGRMLRRQFNRNEYIALTSSELQYLLSEASAVGLKNNLNHIEFMVPEIKMERGYYITEMKKIDFGKISEITRNNEKSNSSDPTDTYIMELENQSRFKIKTTGHFIRWLGL